MIKYLGIGILLAQLFTSASKDFKEQLSFRFLALSKSDFSFLSGELKVSFAVLNKNPIDLTIKGLQGIFTHADNAIAQVAIESDKAIVSLPSGVEKQIRATIVLDNESVAKHLEQVFTDGKVLSPITFVGQIKVADVWIDINADIPLT